ncbi:MAG: TIGR02996 domain-containing protein [Nannocystaceae bacterium]
MKAIQELIERIVADPDDDAGRLAYAQWLDRRGDPRGAFIRAQCRIARPDTGTNQLRDDIKLQSELLAAHEVEWTAELRELLGCTGPGNYHPAQFVRGFIESVIVPADVLAQAAERLFAVAPLLRSIDLKRPNEGDLGPELGHALAQRSELSRIATLRLFCLELDDPTFTALARSPHLVGLAELDLGANHLGPESVKALLASRFAHQLEELKLWRNHVGNAGARQIAAAASPNVRQLCLDHNQIGSQGARALASSRQLKRVSSLRLSHNPLGDEGVCALLSSPHLLALRKLDAYGVGLSPSGVRRLVAIPGLARIKELVIGGNDFGDDGLAALAASPHTGGLVNLDLEGSEIGDAGVQALAGARNLGSLRELGLRYNLITEVGANALAQSTCLPELELDIAYNEVDDSAALSVYNALHRRFSDVNFVGQGRR